MALKVHLLLRLNQLLKLSKLSLIQLLCLNWDWLIVDKLIVLSIRLKNHMRASASYSKLLWSLHLLSSLIILSSSSIF